MFRSPAAVVRGRLRIGPLIHHLRHRLRRGRGEGLGKSGGCPLRHRAQRIIGAHQTTGRGRECACARARASAWQRRGHRVNERPHRPGPSGRGRQCACACARASAWQRRGHRVDERPHRPGPSGRGQRLLGRRGWPRAVRRVGRAGAGCRECRNGAEQRRSRCCRQRRAPAQPDRRR